MKIGICSITDGKNAVYQTCIRNVAQSLDYLDHDLLYFVHQNGVTEPIPSVVSRLGERADSTLSSSREYFPIPDNRNDLMESAALAGCEVVIWVDDDVVVPWVSTVRPDAVETDWVSMFLAPLLADDSVFATGTAPCIITEDFEAMWYVPEGSPCHYLDTPYALRVSMWEALGKYDLQFSLFCDNTDLCLKALLAGHSLVGVKNTTGVLHYHGRTLSRDDFMHEAELGVVRTRLHEAMIERYPEGWHSTVGIDAEHGERRMRIHDFIAPEDVRV